jgi:tetratricopeptide (TPR) repeat protein
MPVNLSAGWESYRRGDFERAARFGEAALADDPDQSDALHLLGLVALRRGDPRRAESLVGRAVAVQPTEAMYHASLAEVCRALGQIDRAIDSCRAACRLKPDRPEYHYNLGLSLMSRGDIDAAIGHLREAIGLNPAFAWAHNNLGNALLLKGEKTAAINHLRQAVQLDPNSAHAHSNLGSALMNLGEHNEALGHYQEAARLRPDFAGAYNNLGNVLHALGRLDESESNYRAAIRLQADLVAAHAGLGRVLEELGDLDQAIAALREALRYQPRNALVLARLATAMPDTLSESERDSIESLLASTNLPPEQRWPLLFGLAGAVDAKGEFDSAASLTFQANALQRADFRRRSMDYDPDAHRTFVDRLIATFTPEFFARVRGLGLETERPVFVVGMPRSGTTLVEQVLASHPRVFGAGERQLVPEMFDSLAQATGRTEPPLDCVKHLDRESIDRIGRRYVDALAALNDSADRIVDKLPDNTFYLGLIAVLFPQAKLIHCRRDLRDVALSCWMTHFANLRWACDPHHIETRIREYRRLMNHWRAVLPVRVLDMQYEAMVADPERSSRELVAWCGLEWDPACQEFYKARRRVRTTSIVQVRQPIYRSSVGRWKNYEQPLAALFAQLAIDS